MTINSSEFSISSSFVFSLEWGEDLGERGEGDDVRLTLSNGSSIFLCVCDSSTGSETGVEVSEDDAGFVGSARRALEGEETVTLSELVAFLLRRDRELRRERLGSEIFFLVLESEEAVLGAMALAALLGLR